MIASMIRDEKPTKRVNPSGKVVWVARWTDRSGKRRIGWPPGIPGTYALRREAQAAIRECYTRDGNTPREGETVGHYAATWLRRHPRSERSNLNYAGRLKAVLDVPIDGTPFRGWLMADVKRWHATILLDVLLRDHGRAASGARGVIAVCSAMFEDAIGDGRTDLNPFHRVRVRAADPRVQRPPRRITVATWEEMHAFAAAAGAYEPMVRTFADCGLRLGEVLALERGHWHGDEIRLCQSAWRKTVTPGTKQAAGRVVPVPPGLRALLEAMPKRIDTRLLFPTPEGDVWHERAFYRNVWRPAQLASGLALRPHDMRHSYVSLMRAAGVDPADLAAATGHTVETATAVYTHSTGATFSMMREVIGA